MDCLWASIRAFISSHHISLSHATQVLPKPQRKGDKFIMEQLVQLGSLSQSDLISCNRCHLALDAVTLADIVTGDGKRIRVDYRGVHPSSTHRSHWEFPIEQPAPRDVDRWYQSLQLLTSASFELPLEASLPPLGYGRFCPTRHGNGFTTPSAACSTAMHLVPGTVMSLPPHMPPDSAPSIESLW